MSFGKDQLYLETAQLYRVCACKCRLGAEPQLLSRVEAVELEVRSGQGHNSKETPPSPPLLAIPPAYG